MSNRWERVGQLFDAAMALPDAERADFLVAECGTDSQLRREVEALIANECDATEQGFLDTDRMPAPPMPPQPPAGADAVIGQRLGNYEVKKLIGRGGMGNVYLATRCEGYKQRVAIKLLKRGMDSEEILRKFRNEIRVLAALGQHPNIARLLDAGTSHDGRPYFVMEYVEGRRIDEYCDKNRLTTRERVELFGKVARAVHFAHQHTIIHRDLKPSNILVSDRGEAKLIDFGIAKITTPELGDETAMPTRTEYRALTPEYASPEQVRGDSLTIATDVYSLGVVLYELLCGHRPERTIGDAVDSSITAVEAPRPSSLLEKPSTSYVDGRQVERTSEDNAALRRTTVRGLRVLLKGDLDNMAGLAVRVEAKQRYASAGQLAADIERYLTGDPIVARPLTRSERFWRTCRRNPLATGVAVALAFGTLFGLFYLSRLSQQLVRETALSGATTQADFLLGGHKYYTQVLDGIKQQAPDAAAALRPPATYTIEQFEYLKEMGSSKDGTQARLLSEYPFTNRADRPPLDDFEKSALDHFAADQGDSYHEFVELDGEPTLRYGLAMRMEQSCCDCHNTHPNSTKTDWEPGQVRGILEVIRPLNADLQRTSRGLQHAFAWMGVVVMGVFAAAIWFFKRSS